jgi:hypothetical protein
MFHPLEPDVRNLKDSEIEEKIQELTKKYFVAQRLGNYDLLTQVSTFVTIYREEMSRRQIEKTKTELDGDLDQLINVNR